MKLQNILGKINKARDAYIERQEQEAERNLARLKTKTARDNERARLSTERAKAKATAERAKAVALRAEAERRRAEKALKGEGILGQLIRELKGSKKPAKRRRKRSGR